MTQGDIALKIARAFSHQRYPLTEEGLVLLERTKRELETGKISDSLLRELPVVENTRIEELFKDFDLTPEEEAKVFGWDLTTIQTHKGCTHQ